MPRPMPVGVRPRMSNGSAPARAPIVTPPRRIAERPNAFSTIRNDHSVRALAVTVRQPVKPMPVRGNEDGKLYRGPKNMMPRPSAAFGALKPNDGTATLPETTPGVVRADAGAFAPDTSPEGFPKGVAESIGGPQSDGKMSSLLPLLAAVVVAVLILRK